MRKNSFRGVVDTVFGGEKPVEDKEEGPKGIKKGKMVQNGKRKAEESVERMAEVAEKPLSKRELKRRAKKARLEGAGEEVDGKDASIKISTDAKEHGDVGSIPRPTTTGTPTEVIKEYVLISNEGSCPSPRWTWLPGTFGSVTMTDGSTPRTEVDTAAVIVVVVSVTKTTTSTPLAAREPVERDATTLFATLADAMV
ncbi:MAG: hypothetical protein Q9179_000768 [Wetmoreana sp. 5 TL-2023]